MQERRLEAIMFTDIEGYTALMQQNEDRAIQVREKHRQIFNTITEKYKGRVLQYYGDGTLSIFDSAIDAVKCGIEMQLEFLKDPPIPVRIGIHTGDIIFSEEEIIGDGVNVASRIESLAVPGSVFISDKVYDEIKNQEYIKAYLLKTFKLKNVERPIDVYAISNAGLIVPKSEDIKGKTDFDLSPWPEKQEQQKSKIRKGISLTILITTIIAVLIFVYLKFGNDSGPTSEKQEKSIAVMPFKDMSAEKDQEYLGEGIAEEIINRLTRVPELKVIGRTSSFSFKNKDTDLKTIGEMLGVETILEGSVQKSGNQLRITAQLINAEDGFHIWSERYDRVMEDIFLLQDELAQSVVAKVCSGAVVYRSKGFSGIGEIDPEAYEFFLKGKHIHQTKYEVSFKIEDFNTAEKMFLKSIDIDSSFALPHAGLADIYHSYQTSFALDDDNPEKKKYLGLQKKHINIAYSLNPQSDYVNYMKGWIYDNLGIYDSAYYHLTKAVILNPDDARNYTSLGYFLFERGLNYEADILLDIAKLKDPLDVVLVEIIAQNEAALGNEDKALEDLNDAILLNPHAWNALWHKILILIAKDRIDEAEETYEKLIELEPDEDLSFLKGALYAARGDSTNTFKTFCGSSAGAFYYSLLGMMEEHVESKLKYNITNSSDNKSNYIEIIHCPYYDWEKDDPRIKAYIEAEKEKYEKLKVKYGNLDFLDLKTGVF